MCQRNFWNLNLKNKQPKIGEHSVSPYFQIYCERYRVGGANGRLLIRASQRALEREPQSKGSFIDQEITLSIHPPPMTCVPL